MGLHLVTSNGTLLKQIDSITSDGKTLGPKNFGNEWKRLQSFSNDEISLDLFFEILNDSPFPHFAILPNVGKRESFQRLNKELADQPRNWFQLDIDWTNPKNLLLHERPLDIELKSLTQTVLKKVGLPPNIGFVSQRSSSAKVLPNDVRIRIYILLDEELNQAGLERAFSAYDDRQVEFGIDLSMAEKARIHIVHDAWVTNEAIEIHEGLGADVVKNDGPRLRMADLKAPIQSGAKRKRTNRAETEKQDRASFFKANEMLRKALGSQKAVRESWRDFPKLLNAIDEHAKQSPEDWADGVRRPMIWWLLREDLWRNGNIFLSLSMIMNNPVIYGENWDSKRLLDIADHQKAYFQDKWGCGNIEDIFDDDEVKVISSFDMSLLSDEEIKTIPRRNTIVTLKAACGCGKTKLAQRLHRQMKPRTSISFCYSKATQEQNAEALGQTFYLDAGLQTIQGMVDNGDTTLSHLLDEKNETARKARFMPQPDHLASTAQSARYARDKYEWVFIDEVEHCLEELAIKPDLEQDINLYSRLSNNMVALLEICLKANFIILADDKMSSDLTGWFIKLIQDYGRHKKFLLNNQADWLQTMNIYGLRSPSHVLQRMAQHISQGKNIAVQTDFANGTDGERPTMEKWRKAIVEACGLEDWQVVSFIAADFDEKYEAECRRRNIPTIRRKPNIKIPEYLEDGIRIILCSTWNQVGWQYNGAGIDHTMNIYTNRFTHAHDVKQGMRRWRLVEDHDVYILRTKQAFGKNVIKGVFDQKLSNQSH